MFSGRKEELKTLKNKYSNNKLEVISILGKRRIGKSQLIAESLRGFDGVIVPFECYKASERANLDLITERIRDIFKNPYLSFKSLFDIVLFLNSEAANKTIVFVLDEYPYMRDGEKTDSELKNAIDEIKTKGISNSLKIIVCGSQIDIMEMLDDANKPLHGRFTERIVLKQLNYLESSLFYPKASLEDKVNYYCVFGGVPYYLEQIDDSLSFDENIINLFFSSHPLIKIEIESQINNEIAKIEKAQFVLDIIKTRTIPYNDILQVFNNSYPNSNMDYALKRLIEIDAIEKIFITQDNGKNKPYYQIKDNALKFYYAFLNYQQASTLLFNSKEYYELFIEDGLKHQYIPFMFEKVAFDFISLMNKANLLPFRLINLFPYIINDKVGKSNFQFDVVGETKDGLINFECKYVDKPINKSTVYMEQRQAELADSAFIKTIFISKSKVDCDDAYYLTDMFSAKLLNII